MALTASIGFTLCLLVGSAHGVVPSRPTNLRVSHVTSTSFQLEWDPSTTSNGEPILTYSVHYHPTNGGTEIQMVTISTRYEIRGLEPHTNYSCYVVAHSSGGTGMHSHVLAQMTDSDNAMSAGRPKRVKRKAVLNEDHMWPNATIHYTVQDAVRNDRHGMGAVAAAIRHIQDTTCVQFTQFPQEEIPNHSHHKFAQFIKGNGCSSSVGRGRGIGAQNISVGQGCAYTEKMIHELGHLVGLWHEHARSDRDNNVVILWNNIRPHMEYNFKKMPEMRLMAPYDVSSLMHYDIDTFSRNGESTIRALDERLTFLIGSRREFSFYDIYTVNKMYNCAAGCPPMAPVCENEGFLRKTCSCLCPRGLTGERCQDVRSSSGCGGVIDVTGPVSLTSPNYQETYPNSLRCTWLLKSPPGTAMDLVFERMDVEQSPVGPCRDRLEVRYHHLGIGRGPIYCGTDIPDPIQSTNDRILIHFETNRIGSNRGFNLTVSLRFKPTCAVNPCQNGGICEEIEDLGDYVCMCPTGWIGHDCQIPVVNGGLSAWSNWTECISTCGIQERSRTCTDPEPQNGGLVCEGATYETRRCGIPDQCRNDFFCDFGTKMNTTGCDLYEDERNAIEWEPNVGTTASLNTGPPSGHTTGDENDAYFYLEASNGVSFDQGIIWLPERNWELDTYCLQFYYSMNGHSIASLAVVRGWSNGGDPTTLWQRSGHQDEGWVEAHINVLLYNTVEVGFLGVRGDAYDSDIAIDDVSVSRGACREQPNLYGCAKPGSDERIALGPFSYFANCHRINCFCNTDGYVDCPEWRKENVCRNPAVNSLIRKGGSSVIQGGPRSLSTNGGGRRLSASSSRGDGVRLRPRPGGRGRLKPSQNRDEVD